jgi:hypothetical protein
MMYIFATFQISLLIVIIARLIWAIVMYFKTREEDKE